jgi:Uma2 family endonuclease
MPSEAPRTIPRGPFKLTIDEYRELPNDGKRYQILDGDLDVAPAPGSRHQRVSRNLEFILVRDLHRRGTGIVHHAPIDVILSRHDIVQPDIVFVRRERRDIVTPADIEGAPDLVVEIVSPSTRRTDVLVKSRLYARCGVPLYWIVDPDIDRIETFRLEGGAYAPEAAALRPDVLRPPSFPGLEIPLEEIFAED